MQCQRCGFFSEEQLSFPDGIDPLIVGLSNVPRNGTDTTIFTQHPRFVTVPRHRTSEDDASPGFICYFLRLVSVEANCESIPH